MENQTPIDKIETSKLKGLARYGSALQWAWVCMALIGSNLMTAQPGQPQSIDFMSLTQAVVSVATFAILGIFALRHDNLFARKALCGGIAVAALVGTLLMALFASGTESPIHAGAFLAGTIIASASAAISLLLWSEYYSQLPLKKAMWYVTASLFLGSGLGLIANLLPFWITAACATVVLPLSAALVPLAAVPSSAETTEVTKERISFASKPQSLRKMQPVFFAYGIAFDFTWSLSFGSGQSAYEFASVLGMVAIMATTIAFAALFQFSLDSFRLDDIVRLVLPLVGGALAVVAVMGAITGPIAYALTQVGEQVFGVALWIVVFSACRSSDRSPVVLFALSRGVNHAGRIVGLVLGTAVVFYSGANSTLLVAITFIVLFVLIILNNLTVGRETHTTLAGQPVVSSGRAMDFDDSLQTRCEQLAERIGLTPRETEILILLARGRSAPRIASELFISEGTVKTHVKHIYEKSGVHGRQELLDLIDTVQ